MTIHARIADLALDVAAGERVLLVGRNGAGKSTLLRTLAGLTRTAGTVRIGGRLGYVPDPKRLPEHTTPLALLSEFGDPGPTLDRLGLGDCRARAIRTLSGSERTRVAVARALMNAPQVLILDEPTAGLDASARELVLAAIAHAGAATLIATPDDPIPADRLLVLAGGRLIDRGPADAALAALPSRSAPDLGAL